MTGIKSGIKSMGVNAQATVRAMTAFAYRGPSTPLPAARVINSVPSRHSVLMVVCAGPDRPAFLRCLVPGPG